MKQFLFNFFFRNPVTALFWLAVVVTLFYNPAGFMIIVLLPAMIVADYVQDLHKKQQFLIEMMASSLGYLVKVQLEKDPGSLQRLADGTAVTEKAREVFQEKSEAGESSTEET